MAPHLWVMSTQSNANINPLHRQRVKGREIFVTEEPRLHLVWWHDRIFVKPLPRYLLSYYFWDVVLAQNSPWLGNRQDAIRSAALGYLRTYRYLVQRETDFRIAQQDHLHLIPREVSWAELCQFVSGFDQIKDNDVSLRYCYGELRLSRLNLYAPLLLTQVFFRADARSVQRLLCKAVWADTFRLCYRVNSLELYAGWLSGGTSVT
jgi:hypothetical protein